MKENKRYLNKYSDLKNFAYISIENLLKKNQNLSKNIPTPSVSSNSLSVYKNLIEKERKHW